MIFEADVTFLNVARVFVQKFHHISNPSKFIENILLRIVL